VILDALRAEGVADNTVVVFIGDNGYFLGEHGLADKWYAYEESLRVPLLVRDPRLPAENRGRRCGDWVLNVDIAPTFCALAGLTPPDTMQGRDFSPLLRGRTPPGWRTDFLYQFKWNSESIPASEGVCGREWKYIRWLVSGTEELFDLRNDPRETRNLAQDPARAADLVRLRSRCAVLKQEVGGARLEDLHDLPFGEPKSAGRKTE
jgi:arylsulfatase A-like enzyme